MFPADRKINSDHTPEKYREEQVEGKAQDQQGQKKRGMPEKGFRKRSATGNFIADDATILKDHSPRNNQQTVPLPDSPVEFFTGFNKT